MGGYFISNLNTGVGVLSSAGNQDIIVIKTDDAGDAIWAIKAGGPGSDQVNAIAADNNGNTYITGYFENSANFGALPVVGTNYEAYVAKIDVNGNFVWVTTMGGNQGDIGHGIDVDNNGNIIVTGEYKGTATFGASVFNSQINPLTSAPSIDIFISKLDNAGNFVWTQDGKASKDDRGLGVSTDNAGNVYVIGQFSDTVSFDVQHNSTLLNAGFVVSFNSAGVEQWFDKMWGTQVLLSDIQWQNNNVFITGDYQNNLLVEDINNTSNYVGVEQFNIFVSQIGQNGDLSWLSSNYSINEVHSRQLTLDASNDIYVAGDFKCTFTEMNDNYGNSTFMSVGFDDIHYLKYDNSGSFEWARQIGSPLADIGTSIAIKNIDKPVVAGTHEGVIYVPAGNTFDFLPGQLSAPGTPNCGDNNYGEFAKESNSGERDMFWTSPFDINRLPFDWFDKDPGLGCDLETYGPCIGPVVSFAQCEDTISGCSPVQGMWNNFTLNGPSPNYNFNWSTGANGNPINFFNQGYEYVVVTTWDNCYSWIDSVFIEIYPDPDPPVISDSWGYNYYDTLATNIDTCEADFVNVWATFNGGPNDTVFWFNEVMINDSTIVVDSSGIYAAVVVNEFGCASDTNFIQIVIQDFALDDTLDPKIIWTDQDIADTDSTVICTFPFCTTIYVLDSAFTNQWGTLPGMSVEFALDGVWADTIDFDFDDTLASSTDNLFTFCVQDVGWHVIDAHIINECGDTVDYFLADSFYVDTVGLPYLLVDIPQMCNGDTAIISATFFADTAYWVGNSILQNYGDSILAVYDNINGLDFSIQVDTTAQGITCSNSVIVNIPPLPAPQLFMNPVDGVVCPGDSVLITVLGGSSWQWIGPNGDSLGTANSQYGSDVGDYFVYVTDNGCNIPSEFVTVNAFSSPQLSAWNPTPCVGDSTTIQVLGPTNTVINWLPPLSGSASTQVVVDGTYYVETTFCGITETDSITITNNIPLAGFDLGNDTTICPYDFIVLMGPPGMNTYTWNGVGGIDSYTVTDSGMYYLHVVDPFGCVDSSDTVLVSYHALPPTPFATDTTICPGGDVALFSTGSGTIDWYTETWIHQFTGLPYIVNNVLNPVNYYVAVTDANCSSIPDTATISFYVDNLVADFVIIDNCGSLAIQANNSGTTGMVYDWNMGDLMTYNGSTVNHIYAGNGTYTVTLITSHPVCNFADTSFQDVTVYGQSATSIFNSPTCYQFSDGSVTVNVANSVGDEIYLIQDAQGNILNLGNSNTANTLNAGWYYWSVQLGPNCTLVDSVELIDPGPLDIDIIVYPPLCYGGTGVAVIDTVYSWQGNYNNISFFWSPNPSGVGGVWADSAYNMLAGNYVVTVNDDNGCDNIIDFAVTEPDPLIFTQLGSEPAYCRLFAYQSGNGVVFAAAGGGTPAYDYLWVNLGTGDSTNNTTWGGLNPGTYEITVTDNNGCILTEIITVDSLNPVADFDMSSLGFIVEWEGNSPLEVHFENQSSYFANPNNPNADTTFYWNFNYDAGAWVISHDLGDTYDTTYTTGTYTICLTAINKNGCSDTLCQEIIVYNPVVFNPVNIFTPDGDGVNDAFTFLYKSEGVEIFHCVVVNRWGVTIREFDDIHDAWDGIDKNGDLARDGVYFYVYKGTGFNGDVFEGQGTVTLIRGAN